MNSDDYFHEMAVAEAENLLKPDDYYQSQATPLNSAESLKNQDRNRLIEFLEMKDTRAKLDEAEQLIRTYLPHLISLEAFDHVKKELDEAPNHFQEKMKVFEEDPSSAENDSSLSLQELFGFSNNTIMEIYKLVEDRIDKNEYQQVIPVIVFLEMMSPHVAGFWLAHAVCLQALHQHHDAITLFDVASKLDPDDPAPIFFAIESYLELNEDAHAKEAIVKLNDVIARLDKEEQNEWKTKADGLRI